MENTHTPCQQQGKRANLDTTADALPKKINGIFMFGCAAREMTKNKCSLLMLQELPNLQDVTKAQAKTRKEPKLWSKIGKFKIGTEKTTRGSWVLGSTKERQGRTTESRKMTPYMIRDLELKSEENLRNKRKSDN